MTDAKRKPGRPPGSGAGRTHTARLHVVLTPEQQQRYQEAADALDVPLGEWVRSACDAFASEER